MIDAPVALALAAGMVATVNPCGFAMLPAYLGYFLGLERAEPSTRASVQRSLRVGLSVSLGFLAVFAVAGLAISHFSAAVQDWAPWATIVIGAALVVLGVALVRGYELTIGLPKLDKGGRSQSLGSMVLFGVSYAVASISCSMPVFMTMVAGTFRRSDAVSSFAMFGAYALGMTLVLLALTLSLGMARRSVVVLLRRALPYVGRASGVLVVLAGGYLAYYGWYELRLRDGRTDRSWVVDTVTGWSDTASSWVTDFGAVRLAWLLAAAIAVVLLATYGVRARR